MIKTYQIPYKYKAMQFDGTNLDELEAFAGEGTLIHFYNNLNRIAIKILGNGYIVVVDVGDYVVKNHLGEFTSYSAEIFSKRFKEVDDG